MYAHQRLEEMAVGKFPCLWTEFANRHGVVESVRDLRLVFRPRTHGSTRFTLPVSSAFFASITTGPSTPSQWPTAHTSNNPVSPIPGDCARKPAAGSSSPRNWASDLPAAYKIAASTTVAARERSRVCVFMASVFE